MCLLLVSGWAVRVCQVGLCLLFSPLLPAPVLTFSLPLVWLVTGILLGCPIFPQKFAKQPKKTHKDKDWTTGRVKKETEKEQEEEV